MRWRLEVNEGNFFKIKKKLCACALMITILEREKPNMEREIEDNPWGKIVEKVRD